MAFKIYVENNHIVVQDLISDKEFRAASKEALFFKDRVSEDTYNTNGFFPEGLQGIKFSDIVDETETPFVNEQSFIDFFSANTGNFNSGGATPQVNYSETEQDTGIKWLNNKPIYVKTFVKSVTVGALFIDTSSIGIEKCIKLESTFNDGGAIYPLPYTLFDNSSVTPSNIIYISKYSMEDGAIAGQFTYNVGTVVTNVSGEFIVTMYYTKI